STRSSHRSSSPAQEDPAVIVLLMRLQIDEGDCKSTRTSRMTRATVPQGLDGHRFGRSPPIKSGTGSFEARMQPSGCMLASQDDDQCLCCAAIPSDRKALL